MKKSPARSHYERMAAKRIERRAAEAMRDSTCLYSLRMMCAVVPPPPLHPNPFASHLLGERAGRRARPISIRSRNPASDQIDS